MLLLITHCVFLSCDCDLQAKNRAIHYLYYIERYNDSTSKWTYLFHPTCWHVHNSKKKKLQYPWAPGNCSTAALDLTVARWFVTPKHLASHRWELFGEALSRWLDESSVCHWLSRANFNQSDQRTVKCNQTFTDVVQERSENRRVNIVFELLFFSSSHFSHSSSQTHSSINHSVWTQMFEAWMDR